MGASSVGDVSNLIRRKRRAERRRGPALGLGLTLILLDIWAFLAGSTSLLEWTEILAFGVLVPLTLAVLVLATRSSKAHS